MILKCIYADRPHPEFLQLADGYEAGFLDLAAIERYAGRPAYDMPESFLRRALATGDECFAIRHGDELAAYGWYSSSANYFTEELTLHFAPEWVYMYRGFTNPAYRGKRLHAIGMTLALRAFLARGFKGLVSCVEKRNDASLKSCYRMGYRPFGSIYGVTPGRLLGIRRSSLRLLNRQFVWCSPGCARFGFWLERTADDVLSPQGVHPLKV